MHDDPIASIFLFRILFLHHPLNLSLILVTFENLLFLIWIFASFIWLNVSLDNWEKNFPYAWHDHDFFNVFQKPVGGVAVFPGLGKRSKKDKENMENEDEEKENREQNEQVAGF